MRALVYQAFGPPDVLQVRSDWPEPALPRDGVCVRMLAGSVNPKDVLLRKGKFQGSLARTALPRATGLDGAGEVVATGHAVTRFKPGDQVYAMTNRFCGGVMAERFCFRESEVAHAPHKLNPTEAASMPLAALTALQAFTDCVRLQAGDRVLINGASGGVGHFAVQIARILGARVHAVCGQANLEFAQSIGADAVHDYARQPATALEERFDVVFDVFGKYRRSDFSDQLGRDGMFISTVPKLATVLPEATARLGLCRNNRLVIVRGRGTDLTTLAQWVDQGLLSPCLSAAFPLDRAGNAHRQIESRHTRGKVCIALAD